MTRAMTMHARTGGFLRSTFLIVLAAGALAGGGCDKGSKGGGGGSTSKGMSGASAVAPKGGLSRALSMMPANTEMVMALDFAKLRSSAIWKKYEPQIMDKIGKNLEEFKSVCGWDPMAKATGALAGGRGKEMEELTVFVRGFDKASVTDCINKAIAKGKAEGKERTAIIDGDYIELQKEDPSDGAVRFAFVDDTTIIFKRAGGDEMAGKDVLMAAIASKPTDGLMSSQTFSSIIDATDTSATAWFVVNGNASFFPPGIPLKFTAVFGSFNAGDGADGTVKLRVADEDTAKGFVTMAKMQMDQMKDSPFGEYIKAVKVEAKGKDVAMSFKLTQAQLESLATMAQSMGGGGF
jgi:hypothetical protein